MRKRKRKGGFCREKRERSYEQYKEVREMKRMKKKRRKEEKKWLVTIGENEKVGTHLV